MKTFKIVQVVEEIYIIEAEDEETATDILYSGGIEPNKYGYMFVDSVEEYNEEK